MADVKEFAKKVAEDQELAEALAKAASKEEFLAKAKEAGFELTEEDLAELAQINEGELSDDELEGAAGGISFDAFCMPCSTCGRKLPMGSLGCPDCRTGIFGGIIDKSKYMYNPKDHFDEPIRRFDK